MKQINYEAAHRALWNWLADHPSAEKWDYFEDWDYNSIPRASCFACEVARQEADRENTHSSCRFCPLGGSGIVGCDGGLYADWQYESRPKRRRRLALQIAKLPWKEKEND